MKASHGPNLPAGGDDDNGHSVQVSRPTSPTQRVLIRTPSACLSYGSLGIFVAMQTATDLLRDRADRLRDQIDALLSRSSVRHFNRDLGGAFYLGPTGQWGHLDTDARRAQSRILRDYDRHCAIVSVLVRGQPLQAARELEEAEKLIREVVDQSHDTWFRTIDEARTKVHEAFEKQKELVDRLHDSGTGKVVLVPDTNALLHNVDLDVWTFSDPPTFELVLTPTVLVELDGLKMNHRNQDVREKAEGLIRRIKGYRSRGSLADGVTLRSGVSSIRSVAEEPRMGESLPWLDPNNRDDRFIASVLEVIRSRPRSAVVIVTRDLNLQNKAEFASLPHIEPPDP